MSREGYTFFHEEQRLAQWMRFIVFGLAAFVWYAIVRQILLGRPFGTHPMPDPLLIVFWLIFGIGLPGFFLAAKLMTEVREDGIYVRFFPFHRRFQRISFEEIADCRVRTYDPIREYGGWGIRAGAQGKAYNASGNRGVQLEFSDGKKLLIGSQKPEQLLSAIHSAAGKSYS